MKHPTVEGGAYIIPTPLRRDQVPTPVFVEGFGDIGVVLEL